MKLRTRAPSRRSTATRGFTLQSRKSGIVPSTWKRGSLTGGRKADLVRITAQTQKHRSAQLRLRSSTGKVGETFLLQRVTRRPALRLQSRALALRNPTARYPLSKYTRFTVGVIRGFLNKSSGVGCGSRDETWWNCREQRYRIYRAVAPRADEPIATTLGQS